jgi:hypothetical protein
LSQDNRKGHHGEDNNIYLNDANLNNTKDLATTLGHETSHAIDNQDPSIDTNPHLLDHHRQQKQHKLLLQR